MLGEARLVLPWPVPLHACFFNRGRKGGSGTPTKRYRDYAVEAKIAWLQQGRPRVRGRVHVKIKLCPPDRRRYDCDNFGKCVMDNLVNLKVIEEDNNRIVRSLFWEWVDDGPPCEVQIIPADLV